MNKSFRHFKTIVHHKWEVGKLCWSYGLYWQGLVHDLSKFSPIEFGESIKYYTGVDSPIGHARAAQGYSDCWNHHKGRNKHHFEYWYDDQNVELTKMPFKYALEMVCDMVGASKAYRGKDFNSSEPLVYWRKKRGLCIHLHQETKDWLTYTFCWLSKFGELPDKNTLKCTYENAQYINTEALEDIINEN